MNTVEIHDSSPKRRPVCTKCATTQAIAKRSYPPAVRDPRFDAYYCPQCREWLEDRCDDHACEFCVSRPIKA